jgi:hypothetical protein
LESKKEPNPGKKWIYNVVQQNENMQRLGRTTNKKWKKREGERREEEKNKTKKKKKVEGDLLSSRSHKSHPSDMRAVPSLLE